MKKQILLVSMFTLSCKMLLAQSIIISPGTSNAVCPGTLTTYTAVNPNGSPPACRYEWTVTNGRFSSGGSVGRSVDVIWNDNPGTGTLKVVLKNCGAEVSNFENVSKTNTYTILSVAGQSFGSYTNSVDVPYCYTGTVVLFVPKMYVKGTGGAGQPPRREVDFYLWVVPDGWKIDGTNIQGPTTHAQTTNTLVLTPIEGKDGTVQVQGSLNNTCLGNYGSNPATITLRRTPIINVSAPAGYLGPRCGLKVPVTFTVPSTVPCATSYSWSFPPGWQGSSTSNSITLTPSGTAADGGDIQVTIGLSTGQTIGKKYTVEYLSTAPSNPVVTKSSSYFEMCPGDSWTFTCTPPSGYPTNYGFDWYVYGASLRVDGVTTSSNSPLHTTINTVTVTPAPGAYGTAYVTARLSSEGCTPSGYSYRQTRVGPYSNSEFLISGPSSVCPNSVETYLSSYIGPDILDYQWSAPSGWSSSGQGTPYFSVSIPYSFSGGAITLRLKNRCGTTNTPYVLPLYPRYGGCGYSYYVSPNPVSDVLTVSDYQSSEMVDVVLTDINNKNARTAKEISNKMEIDVRDLPDGLYILRVRSKEKTESYNIIVDHKQ